MMAILDYLLLKMVRNQSIHKYYIDIELWFQMKSKSASVSALEKLS